MSTVADHPAFERAAEELRWTGSKAELWRAILSRAFDARGERWVWYITEAGLLVECQVNPPGTKHLRFWFETDDPPRFRRACEQFLTHCPIIGQWRLIDEGEATAPDDREGVRFAWYMQGFGGER